MKQPNDGPEEISERLNQAISELSKDVAHVEIWAMALGSFSKPVPDYWPNPKYRLGRGAKNDKK
jgi:hypothetical protein